MGKTLKLHELETEANQYLKTLKILPYDATDTDWEVARIDPNSKKEQMKKEIIGCMPSEEIMKGWYIFKRIRDSDDIILYVGCSGSHKKENIKEGIQTRFIDRVGYMFNKAKSWRHKFWREQKEQVQIGERWEIYWLKALPHITHKEILSIERLLQIVLQPYFEVYKATQDLNVIQSLIDKDSSNNEK